MRSDTTITFDEIVHISEGAKPSVNLVLDYNDSLKVKSYIPTKIAIEMFEQLAIAVSGSNTSGRVRYLYGPYGGGKSHLALVLQYFMRFGPQSEAIKEILKKVTGLGNNVAEEVQKSWTKLKGEKGFLVVILQANEGSFRQAMLKGLNRALRDNLGSELAIKLQPTTIYDAAIQQLELWKKEHLDLFQKAQQLVDLDKLVIDLRAYDHLAFVEFNEIFKRVTGGGTFDPGQWVKTGEVYYEVAKKLVNYGYNGIYVIHDEFGDYIGRAIRDEIDGNYQSGPFSRSDGIEFQDFAEMCISSGEAQIHYLMCAHLDISRYAELNRGDEDAKQTWEKYFGRAQKTLISSLGGDKEVIQLIDGVIIQFPEKWNEFVKNGAEARLVQVSRDARNNDFFPPQDWEAIKVEKEVVHGCYPLHPVSLYALPRLSVLLGQNERTMFTFVSGSENGTLGSYIHHHEPFFPRTAPMLTVDKLLDYFLPSIDSNRPKQKDWYKGAIYSAGGESAPNTDIRLIKLLTLWQIMREGEVVPLTVERAAFALDLPFLEGLESLNEAVNRLKSKEILYVNKDKVLNPYGVDRASIEDSISERIKKIRPIHRSGHFLKTRNGQLLSASLRIEDIAPIPYQRDFGVMRCFTSQYVMINELVVSGKRASNFTSPFQQLLIPLTDDSEGADGIVLYMLPQTPTELQAIKTAATGVLKHPRVLIVIPQNPVEIEGLTLRLEAIMSLLDQNESKEEIRLRLQDKQAEVVEQLEGVLEPVLQFTQGSRGAEVYCNGKKLERPINNLADLEIVIDTILRQTYSFEVPVKDENFGQRKVTPASSKIRKNLIRDILRFEALNFHDRQTFGYSDTSAERRVLRSVLVAHKILRSQGSTWVIDRPVAESEKNLEIIWDKIHSYFFGQDGTTKPIEPLVKTLLEPPYGIYRNLLPIYFAAVIHRQTRQITFYIKNKELANNTDLASIVEQLIEKPEDYNFKWQGVNIEQRTFMTAILKELGMNLEVSDIVPDRLVKEFGNLYRALSPFTQRTQEIIGPVLTFRDLLRQAEQSYADSEKIIENLATVLEAQNIIQTSNGRVEFFAPVRLKFSEYYRQLENFPKQKQAEISTYLEAKLVQFLNLLPNSDYSAMVVEFRRFLDTRDPEALASTSNMPGIQVLLHAINNEQPLSELIEALALSWTKNTIKAWNDTDYQRFKFNVDNIPQLLSLIPEKLQNPIVIPNGNGSGVEIPKIITIPPYLEQSFILAILEILEPDITRDKVDKNRLVTCLANYYAELPKYTRQTRHLPDSSYKLRKVLEQTANRSLQVDSLLEELANVVGLKGTSEYSENLLDQAGKTLWQNLEQLNSFVDSRISQLKQDLEQKLSSLLGQNQITNSDDLIALFNSFLESRDKIKLQQVLDQGLKEIAEIPSIIQNTKSLESLATSVQEQLTGHALADWNDNLAFQYNSLLTTFFERMSSIPIGPVAGKVRITVGINQQVVTHDVHSASLTKEIYDNLSQDLITVLKKYSLYNSKGIFVITKFLKSIISAAAKSDKN